MVIDKDMVLSVISLFSVLGSGYMLHKSNLSKDKTKTHVETLEAESEFRSQLMKDISRLKADVNKLSVENVKLKEDLHTAQVEIRNLELLLSEKINKCKVIENFLSHLTTPAWLRLRDNSGKYRFAYVNFAFCNHFDVSGEYCIGQADHTFISKDIDDKLHKLSEILLLKKIGIRGAIEHDKCILSVLKFPVIEDGDIIGIGGILVDCKGEE